MRTRRWAPLPVIAAMTLLLGGCGNGPDDNGPDRNGPDRNGPNVPGAPADPDRGREAPPSPLDIPHYSNQGQDIDGFLEIIRGDLAAQCEGGELCVELRVERSYRGTDDPEACGFDTTDPPPGSRVEPGSVIVVKAVCGGDPEPTDPPASPSTP